MNRRTFVRHSMIATAAATLAGGSLDATSNTTPVVTGKQQLSLDSVRNFAFTRLRYASGNWDADPRMPSNLLHTLAEYTSIRADGERVLSADRDPLLDYRFLYLTGNKAVRFTEGERAGLRRYLRGGGFLFVDDCEHDTSGPFAQTVEHEIGLILDRPGERLRKLPNNHELYRAFFAFPDGPPATSHESNGWGDRTVHNYLRAAVASDGRLRVLYSNKDYGCEWNYEWSNKRFTAEDKTRFGLNIIAYALTH